MFRFKMVQSKTGQTRIETSHAPGEQGKTYQWQDHQDPADDKPASPGDRSPGVIKDIVTNSANQKTQAEVRADSEN